MKKTALLLLTGTAAIASAQDCCDPCEPCCVPKPKKCIDCECYTPAFYDLQCDWGASLDIEFLYWYAGENNLPLASKSVVFGVTETLTPLVNQWGLNDVQYMKPSWDPGFRVGIGFNSECDGWDVNLTYTWYKNSQSSSLSGTFDIENAAVGQAYVVPFWDEMKQGSKENAVRVLFSKSSGSWKFWYNVLDLEMGRKYWLSKCFNLRPFIGLRGAWDKTEFNVRSSASVLNQGVIVEIASSPSYTNRYWGVGVVGGIDPTFYFTPCFALYGQLDMALVWGKAKSKVQLKQTFADVDGSLSQTSSASESHARMQPMYTAGLGIRWEDTYCCDRYRFALDLGWEHSYLDEHNARWRTESNYLFSVEPAESEVGIDELQQLGSDSVDTYHTGLGLGGFVLRARFDF